MTSWHSLLACPQADVTIERLAGLAATTGTEPLTVDFKEKADRRVADCVASMANASGGLVLIGITDTDHKIRPGLAPWPVMVQRTGLGGAGIFWAPVRIPGGTRQATRAELAALFAEPAPRRRTPASGWEFNAPQLPTGPDDLPDSEVDMMLKTGLSVMPGPACPGRPLSENVVSGLAAALDNSPLAETLFALTRLPFGDVYNTARRGRPNTSGKARLTWQVADGTIAPFEITTRIVAPGSTATTTSRS